MSITRANVESILIRRSGSLMTAAGLDGVTVNGTNHDLNDPIGFALRLSGYPTDNPALIDDSDLLPISSENIDKLLDLAEWRVLESILGNLDEVDITLGPRREALGQLASAVERRAGRLQEKLAAQYGILGSTLEGGHVTLDFAEHNETLGS